ncbi:alpha-2-macroglobulin [Bordetella sp. 15P40C-2]|uniref:alpha-2-macroglobulin family protein n=1 Tax=Bordetella sp. 15P40C-2 TaxID=2572246 RepID=UPI001327C405|nr:MG2 domain-containing protein [Bordetella sp. 15P40C-2]MVW70608.1 alpha-2-macroglobulin family protein [Bordetella sp. 15P40C-2]
MGKKGGVIGIAAVVIAATIGAGLWLGRSDEAAGEPPAAQAPQGGASSAGSNPASTSAPGGTQSDSNLPATALVGQADPFGMLDCKPRQFQDAMALAITFTQPVDRKSDLSRYITVLDQGPAPTQSEGDDVKQRHDSARSSSQADHEPAGTAAATGKVVEGAWTIGDNPRIVYFPYVQPQRSYALRVRADLPGAGGATLGGDRECEVQTEAMPPSFYFASRGVVLPAGQNGGLPVATVNMPEVDVQFLRVPPEQLPAFYDNVLGLAGTSDSDEGNEWRYADNRSLKGLVSTWDLDRLHSLAKSVYQGRFLTDDKPNRRHVTFLPVEKIAELQQPGIYVAIMSEPGRFRYEYQVSYFYISDMGLHVRRYSDRTEAYVISLKSGQPVGEVQVELVDGAGKVLAKAATDTNGHVRFDGDASRARVIRAVRGGELTLLSLGEPALDLSEFDIGGHVARPNNLFVYAGRNLYRPGETFQVSVLPRDLDGKPIASVPLTAVLKRPDGRVVRSELWQPDEKVAHYVQRAISLPVDAQTGKWLLELRVDPASKLPDASWWFQTEEFLPERMKLHLDTDQTSLVPDQVWTVDVQGDYLYGAPAAGNRLLASFQVKRERYPLKQQWPGFVFGDVADDTLRHYEELPETTLDDKGLARLTVDPQSAGAVKSPMSVRLSASLLESGGRPVVRSLERTIWPADKLIAVRPLFNNDVTRQGAPAGFELVRVNTKGEVVPLPEAQLRLFRERRDYYWRYDDQRGWNSGYTETEDLEDSRTLALPDRTSLTLPVDWGRYRLEVTDPETGHVLRYRFYAGWDAQDADTVGNRPDRVQMKLEGAPARPGDTVKLTVTPPHDGQALITVEGDRMLWSKWAAVKATGTQIDIPVDASWKRHDLYVSAVVFRPGSAGDRITPARAVGLTYLPIANDDRRLDVSLSAPAKVEPEKPTTVRVKVDGAQGQAAHVTLSAVDVGILNINQYATPDPMDFFFGKHRYDAELRDMYGKLIEKMDGTQGRLKWGGDAAMRGDSRSLPKKVKLVDLFSGPVALNDKGEGEIPLNLPDFNGTLRLMVVAFTDANFGHAEQEMVVAAPIVAELNMPRFISPGDRATVAVDVANLSGATQQVKVNLNALDPLSIADGGTRTLTLRDKQRATVRFTATPTGSYGPGLMRLTVESQGGPEPIRIEREAMLQVQPAHAAEQIVRRVRLGAGETFAPGAQATTGYYPDSVTANITLSNRPPINVSRLVQDLLRYPYGCTEQTISAVMPWALLDEQDAKRFGLTVPDKQQRADKISAAIGRLAGMRSSTGAYSLWGNEGSARDVWLTAYAVGFLQDAREQGFEVPETAFARSRQWLQEQLQQSLGAFGTWPEVLRRSLQNGNVDSSYLDLMRNDHRRFAGYASAALVLAREKQASLATLRQLFDRYQERALSPLPLIQMAAAFELMGDTARMNKAMELAYARPYGYPIRGRYQQNAWLGDYGSPVRDYALGYAIASQYGLAPAQRQSLLSKLDGLLRGRAYFSTQEQMALVLAARAAGGDADKPWNANIQMATGGRVVSKASDETIALSADVLPTLQVTNTGTAPLFVEYDMQGTRTEAPAPRGDAIKLQRRWYTPDGKPWDGGVLRTGDMLVVRLTAAANQTIPDALIVDRVPAGLEIENLNLSQSPEMRDWEIDGVSVADAMSNPAIKHREFRDDRYVVATALGGENIEVFYMARVVTPGRYVVPSTVAEDMYRPELRGVGERWSPIEVRDRVSAR